MRDSRISRWIGGRSGASSLAAWMPRSLKRRAEARSAGVERSDELVVGVSRLAQVIADVGYMLCHGAEPLVELLAQRLHLLGVLRHPLLLPGRGDGAKQRHERQRRRGNDPLIHRVIEQRRIFLQRDVEQWLRRHEHHDEVR